MRVFVAVLLLTGCTSPEEAPDDGLCDDGRCDVFGTDDRRDPFDPDVPAHHRLAVRSTGALLFAGKIASRGDTVELTGGSVADLFAARGMPLCEGERFATEPARSHCSGSLVGPNTFLTAAHCVQLGVPLDELCGNLRVAFGYAHATRGDDPTVRPADDIYACRAIRVAESNDDWALITLDRDVTDRDPLPLAGVEPTANTPLLLIGHPLGMPAKLALGRVVDPQLDRSRFVSDHDAFQGNSGSALLDPDTLEVTGVLSAGSQDFVPTDAGCWTATSCDEVNPGPGRFCTGTLATRISRVVL